MGYLCYMGTYEGVASTHRLRDLWQLFHHSSPEGRLAKDFDKLECLHQLYSYRRMTSLEQFSDAEFSRFRADLKNRILTNTVRQIRDRIEPEDEELSLQGEGLLSKSRETLYPSELSSHTTEERLGILKGRIVAVGSV
jgi:hypothetical protein